MDKLREDKLREILRDHGKLAVDAMTLAPDADLFAAGLTSFATIQVMLAIEDAFGVEIPDDAAETITTVGDAVKFLTKAQAA